MKRIIVLVKNVPDFSGIIFSSDPGHLDFKKAKQKLADLDKRALEAALRLKEKNPEFEVVTLSLGDESAQRIVLNALAMGADSSYMVKQSELDYDSLSTGKVLKTAVEKIGSFDLIIAGEMSMDTLGSQTGPIIAELLGLTQVTYVKQIELLQGEYIITRDLDEVDEIVKVKPPLLITVVREINEPRIPSLINIMRAKKKPVVNWSTNDLELSKKAVENRIKTLETKTLTVKRKKIKIEAENIQEAAEKLVICLLNERVLEGS